MALALSLDQLLTRLDALPALLESIREHYSSGDPWFATAERIYPHARHALERVIVAVEDGITCSDIDLGDMRFIELLERLKPKTSENLNEQFMEAIKKPDVEMVELLLKHRNAEGFEIDPSAYNNFAICYASENGHVAVVDRLLQERKVDPSANDNYAICYASKNGHVAVVHRLLREQKVDPSADDNYAIIWASANGHVAVVDRLLQDGTGRVDPSANDNRAIQLASMDGHVAVVDRLLRDERVDPSACDNSAIQWASQNGHVEVVELLKVHAAKKSTYCLFAWRK